jgi:hypothetical protein
MKGRQKVSFFEKISIFVYIGIGKVGKFLSKKNMTEIFFSVLDFVHYMALYVRYSLSCSSECCTLYVPPMFLLQIKNQNFPKNQKKIKKIKKKKPKIKKILKKLKKKIKKPNKAIFFQKKKSSKSKFLTPQKT